MARTKIGIIGSGQVGKVFAEGFAKHGHPVMIGTRDPQKLDELKNNSRADIRVGSFEETAKYGDLLVLAVKGTVAEKLVKELASFLKGKTVIDATNPIADAPPQNGVLNFFTKPDRSLMEALQEAVPSANFVKAFSSVGNSRMVDPRFTEGKPTMFICGDNDSAKKETEKILESFGWDVCDMGKATSARAIEPLCILWCIPGFLRNEWTHAFKLLKT